MIFYCLLHAGLAVRGSGTAGTAAVDTAADAGDREWAESDDDGEDDEATLDAEEMAAAADGVDVKVRVNAHLCISWEFDRILGSNMHRPLTDVNYRRKKRRQRSVL